MGKEDDFQNSRAELVCSRYSARCLEHSPKERPWRDSAHGCGVGGVQGRSKKKLTNKNHQILNMAVRAI